MKKILIKNAVIYTPTANGFNGWVVIEDKKILSIQRGSPIPETEQAMDQVIDAEGKALLPGFIDVHTHGGLGFCTMDADQERLKAIARRNAEHGVTSFLPTTLTDTKEATIRAIEAVTARINVRDGGAKTAGIHLEGPYFNPVKAGAQDPDNIRRADKNEIRDFLKAGKIRLIAMAPEYPENLAAGDLFAAEGITVSAGHTNASYDDLVKAAEHGFSEITHLYNGMGAFGHRDPGTIGGALTIPAYTCELICDNVHSHPATHRLVWKAKGPEKIILITDCIRPSGLPDGTYPFTDKEMVTVSEHGTNLRLKNGSLAGSALTMDRALFNFMNNTGTTLDEVWRCGSLNAAIQIGISAETGSIEKGKLADLILLDAACQVKMTMIEGEIVYQ